MSQIVEIVSSKGNGGQQFTVDTSGPLSVPIATHGSFEIDNAIYKSVFHKGDNLQIIGAGIVLPESFCLATNGFGAGIFPMPKLNIYLYTEPGHVKYYPSIAGADGTFFVPFENFEYILNAFVDTSAIPQHFAMYLSVDPATVNISMLNVPAALHGTVQRIVPFVKVLHNIPMEDA